MEFIQSVDRPDVNEVPPKMSNICARAQQVITGPPYLRISTNDNIMFSVWVKGSFDPQETWVNRIYENSHCFSFMVTPSKGGRYYQEGEDVTVELMRVNHKFSLKFRKYTGSPEKCIQKIAAWIQQASGEELHQKGEIQ